MAPQTATSGSGGGRPPRGPKFTDTSAPFGGRGPFNNGNEQRDDYSKSPNARDNGGNRLPGMESQEGSYYVGMPSPEKYHRMNGIKTNRPGQNRVDFGPNDNYDDRL